VGRVQGKAENALPAKRGSSMIFSPSDYITIRQAAKEFPAWPAGTLMYLASTGACPAILRIKTNPKNQRAKIIVIKPLFELWMISNAAEFKDVIDTKKDAINAFLESLVKREPGRPKLKVAEGR